MQQDQLQISDSAMPGRQRHLEKFNSAAKQDCTPSKHANAVKDSSRRPAPVTGQSTAGTTDTVTIVTTQVNVNVRVIVL